jgi:hypothetical protein
MKNYGDLLTLFLFVAFLFVAASETAPAFRTADNWTGKATVDSAATLSQTWVKPVRDVTDAQIHFDMDTITASGVDSMTITLYRSIFDDPTPDQWVPFDTIPIAHATSVISDISVDFKKIKFECASSDTIANTLEWQMWLY